MDRDGRRSADRPLARRGRAPRGRHRDAGRGRAGLSRPARAPTPILRPSCSPRATSTALERRRVSRSSARAGAPGAAPGSPASSAASSPRRASRWCPASPSGSTGQPTVASLDAGGRPIGRGRQRASTSCTRLATATCGSASASAGLLLSEAPLGARPTAWRFPARNRIIAGLADLVVVVESHAAGGSMHTVREAADRDIQVMAVPGSVRSPSAAGTNQLLAEGCAPVRDATDVLVALGLTAAPRAAVGRPPGPARSARQAGAGRLRLGARHARAPRGAHRPARCPTSPSTAGVAARQPAGSRRPAAGTSGCRP